MDHRRLGDRKSRSGELVDIPIRGIIGFGDRAGVDRGGIDGAGIGRLFRNRSGEERVGWWDNVNRLLALGARQCLPYQVSVADYNPARAIWTGDSERLQEIGNPFKVMGVRRRLELSSRLRSMSISILRSGRKTRQIEKLFLS